METQNPETDKPSIRESGYVKNLASLEQMITYCTTFGGSYLPTNAACSLENLRALHTAGKQVLERLAIAKAAYDKVVNERQFTFAKVRPLASRTVSALVVSGASKETIDDARGYLYKLLGKRARPAAKTKVVTNTSASGAVVTTVVPRKTISVAQTSYDWQVEHFAHLILTLKASASYHPNEKELSTDALTALMNEMYAHNSAVIAASATYSMARISRDDVFQKPNTGLIDVCLSVKTYVKSLYGHDSPQYKQVRGIKFKRNNV